MAAVVHFSIWKTCKIHTTYQEIDNYSSVIKCSSFYFNGGIAYRRTYLYCRADYVLHFRNQNIRTNKVNESNSKLGNTLHHLSVVQISHKTSQLLSLPTIWSYCNSVLARTERCSMCSIFIALRSV